MHEFFAEAYDVTSGSTDLAVIVLIWIGLTIYVLIEASNEKYDD